IKTIQFVQFTKAAKDYVFGPVIMNCAGSQLAVPPLPSAVATAKVPRATSLPAASAGALVVEKFATTSTTTNTAKGAHGSDDTVPVKYAVGSMTLSPQSPDGQFFTTFGTASCANLNKYKDSYLHISVKSLPAGQDFDISLQQHNDACNDLGRFPVAWDDIQASDFLQNGEIYIPMKYFSIDLTKVSAVTLKAFKSTAAVQISLLEIVDAVPAGLTLPGKPIHAPLIFGCKVPNTIAFCIDDGDPTLAPQVMKAFAGGDKATFFALGTPLLDTTNGLAAIYKSAQAAGHQLEQHSSTHPFFAILPDWAIDYQLDTTTKVFQDTFGKTPSYFRPPFGVIDSRSRQHLGSRGMKTIMWDIDVEDYLWADSSTPNKQLDAFNRDLKLGGSIVVMHYLSQTTVNLLPKMIASAKASGKKLVRLDQCLGDAPLYGSSICTETTIASDSCLVSDCPAAFTSECAALNHTTKTVVVVAQSLPLAAVIAYVVSGVLVLSIAVYVFFNYRKTLQFLGIDYKRSEKTTDLPAASKE
ncbi:hypothetical protein HDU91_007484, partial [Kappamyces sp. JEL0680]